MKKSQVLAILALALAMGLTTPIASVFATEGEVIDNTAVVDGVSEDTNTTSAPQSDDAGDDSAAGAADGITENVAPVSTPAPVTTTSVANEADLQMAINDTNITEITLTGDITVSSTLTINRAADQVLVIKLAGHTISGGASTDFRIFSVTRGNVRFENGTIDASASAGGIAIKIVGHDDTGSGTDDGSWVYIDGDVTIKAGSTSSAYGVAIYPQPGTNKAGFSGVTLKGKIDATDGSNGITVLGSVKDTAYVPNISVMGGAEINAGDTGIYAAGFSCTYVGESTVRGATGITAKAGYITVAENALVEGTGAFTPVPDGATLNNNGAEPTGAGIQVESNGAYAGKVNIIIAGDSTIKSATGPAIYGYGDRANHEAIESVIIEEGSKLVAGAGQEAIAGVAKDSIENIEKYDPGQGEEKPADKKVEKAPGTGVVAATENSAQKTASVMAAIATALTVAGTAVVIRRNALCNAKKN